jgi:hypothetical protein
MQTRYNRNHPMVTVVVKSNLHACRPSRGILRLRRTIPLLLEEICFETACVDS